MSENRSNSKKNEATSMNMEAIAKTGPKLLFFEFNCPVCGEHNVRSKAYATEFTLCSRSSCKRMVHIKNFHEAA